MHRKTHTNTEMCAHILSRVSQLRSVRPCVCACVQQRSSPAFTVKHCTKEIEINTFCSIICHIFTRLKPSEHQSILLWRHLSSCHTLTQPTLTSCTRAHTHTHTRTHTHTHTHRHTCPASNQLFSLRFLHVVLSFRPFCLT